MHSLEKQLLYLCPPGDGVHTVHTAKENKFSLRQRLYKSSEDDQIKRQWSESLKSYDSNSKVPVVFGITLDTGGGIQRGANWGPLFIRTQILKNRELDYFDVGDTKTIPHLIHDKYLNQETILNCREALYKDKNINLPVSGLSIAEDFSFDFFSNNKAPLITLGGDHSVSYPVVKSWLRANKGKKTAIIHFDAHTDLMDQRLGVDICFATWAKKIMPYLNSKSDLIQLGIRSSGQAKDYWESETGVQQFWAKEIHTLGTQAISDHINNYLDKNSINTLYVSFDIDALDAKYASATGTPEIEGLAPHQCVEIIKQVCKNRSLTGADLVEVAPFVASSKKDSMSPEPQTTLQSSAIIVNTFLDLMK